MKQLLIATAIMSVFAAPALATPSEAFTLWVLLGAAALGLAIINDMVSSKLLPWVESRAYARINYGYIRR